MLHQCTETYQHSLHAFKRFISTSFMHSDTSVILPLSIQTLVSTSSENSNTYQYFPWTRKYLSILPLSTQTVTDTSLTYIHTLQGVALVHSDTFSTVHLAHKPLLTTLHCMALHSITQQQACNTQNLSESELYFQWWVNTATFNSLLVVQHWNRIPYSVQQ